MTLIQQAGVIIGVISGAVGLLFLFLPGLKPERHEPAPEQSASISGLVLNPRTTRGQFLDYSDQSKLGFTRDQLAIVGASAFARVRVVGYRGEPLILQRQVIDARTGNVIGRQRDFQVRPTADTVSHRWWDWAPLPSGRGSYVMVIKLLEKDGASAIACGQSRRFGGLAGSVAARSPQLCEEP
jgi:hypothetical protein